MIECEHVEPTLLETIRFVSGKYTPHHQWAKAIEELREALEAMTLNLEFGHAHVSELADVIIMAVQVIMQHSKMDELSDEMRYKLFRQVERMNREGKLSVKEYARYSAKGQEWEELIKRMSKEN